MSAYFFKVSQAEKNNILDQHKQVYDGFVTTYGQQINQQPLYVQDYANDKEGMVVSNKGVVKSYTNMNINEAFDKIADDSDHFEHGTFDDEEPEFDEIDIVLTDMSDDFDEDVLDSLQEQVNKTLDMFKRFKNC